MLVWGLYHVPCQVVIPFFFFGLVKNELFFGLLGDNSCQYAPIFVPRLAGS
jgi:hypothetical protein